MGIISPKLHSYFDYAISAVLLALPWLMGIPLSGHVAWIPVVLGLMILTMSVLTRFRQEHFGIIPLPTHLITDIGIGALLAGSPWFFDFHDGFFLPHLTLGILIVATALFTSKTPFVSNSVNRKG